ncbi:hypothetical protein [Prescottella equi]|uniref:hypothetical protein n=1 Tax=Rhodococcus hoagii TaxID=43767 RepID=UPI001EEB81E3|nr:hypothetical protein [Prescottella equi]
MSTRDELANLIDDAIGWAGQEDIALADHITDAILAAGYVKADSEEWAVEGDNPEPWFQDAMISSRDDAEAVACNYRSGRFSPGDSEARVVRRLVGPWEVA